jgi:Ca2+-binding RTX toxin-like protein
MLQLLESRRLLSVAASFEGGVISVIGSRQPDDIRVATMPLGGWSIKSGQEIVTIDTGGQDVNGIMVLGGGRDDVIDINLNENDITVTVCGHSGNDQITGRSFRAPGVFVYGGYGADTIDVRNSLGNGGGLVDGMWDNDRITVANSFSSRAPRVYGGSGDDLITAQSEEFAAGGHYIFGGPGNDTITASNLNEFDGGHVIRGEAGNDAITGSVGRDYLFGDDGNDVIRGGAGNDVLFGGAGNDRLYGHAGDDFFDGGFGKDRISGEEGDDIALRDPLDVVAGIDALI